jgi:large subunit ribosomal protein L28
MAKCEVCDKTIQTGHKISITRSHVSRRANKIWKSNVKKIKINDNGTVRSAHVCTRCMRSGRVDRIIGSSNIKPEAAVEAVI